jgi:hypothetical protein
MLSFGIFILSQKATHGTQRMSLGIFILPEKSPWDTYLVLENSPWDM